MPKFWWTGLDGSGKQIKGYLQADSQDVLRASLLQRGIALLDCKIEKHNRFSLRKKLTKYDFIDFFDQMAVLLDGGVDLLSAIRTIELQIQNNVSLRDVLSDLRINLQAGSSLSQALSKYDKIFNDFIIQMVEVGLRSGNLGFVMGQVSMYLKKQQQLRKDLINAALMPMFTIFFAMLIVVVILIVVVPQFELFFNSLGKQLPTATKRIIGLSKFLKSWRAACTFITIFLGSIGIVFAVGTARVKRGLDRILLALPVVGNFVALSNITYFLQALTVLLKSGIPVKDAVACAQNSMNNICLKAQFGSVIDDIMRGHSLSEAIASLPLFYRQENLVVLIKVGEQTGALAEVLNKATLAFQEELKRFVLILTSFFQPILLIVVGLIVGFLIWLIYLPIFNLAYAIN